MYTLLKLVKVNICLSFNNITLVKHLHPSIPNAKRSNNKKHKKKEKKATTTSTITLSLQKRKKNNSLDTKTVHLFVSFQV
jgi:hypothetical protein